MGRLLRQQMAQWAGHLQDATVGIKVQMQAEGRRAQRVGQVDGGSRRAVEQTSEEFFPRVQNCRLDVAVRNVGRLGTVPTPGNTRNGIT